MEVAAWHIRARELNTTLVGNTQETKMNIERQVICVEFSGGHFKRMHKAWTISGTAL